jgi:hypothetical protein
MVAPARARAATYTPMAPLAKALSSPAQTAQAAAYGGPSLGQIDSRRALAMQLIGNATEGPTGGGWGALAKALTAGVGAYAYRKADQQEGDANKAMIAALNKEGGPDIGALSAIDPKAGMQFQMAKALKDPQETYTEGMRGGMTGNLSSTGKFEPYPDRGFSLGPGDTRFGAGGQPIASIGDPNQPFNPDGTPNAAYQQYQFDRAAKGKTSVNVTATGGHSTLTPATTSELQKRTINASDQIARLDTIKAGYRPEYQQIGTRAGMGWANLKDKFGALPDQDKAGLAGFATYKRDSVNNLSQVLNDLSGAAISPQEFERLKATMPNAGTGLFDGDGPTEFEAKLNAVMRDAKAGLIRYQYTLAKGIPNPFSIPLEQVPALIDQVGAEIEGQIQAANPGIDPATLEAETMAQLQAFFGGAM